MKTTLSYAVELKHTSKIFYPTIKIYQRAVSFCVSTFENEWSSISSVTDSKQRKGYAERLIHSTKSNQAKYPEFDEQFFKLPSYLRRSAINTALGHLQSYHSNLENWLNSKQTAKKPVLQINLNKLPAFYKDGSYKGSPMDADSVSLKLFVNNDWIWVPFTLKHTDMNYIRKQSAGSKLSVPTLEKKHKKWFLRFSFEDLSASYNIAARYFIREIEKSTSAMKWSQAVANVKSLAKRTLNTYSSFLELLSLA